MSSVKQLAQIAFQLSGIKLGEDQYPMIEARLKARMIKLNLSNIDEYLKYYESNQITEGPILLSLVTTHYTYFFREFSHFEFIINKGLKSTIEKLKSEGRKTINILCAACSYGEEAYSLAMLFDYHLKYSAPDLDYHIDAGDIDLESVKKAQNGVYRVDSMKQIPAMYVGDHWAKGTGAVQGFAKVRDSIKRKISFDQLNVISPAPKYANKKYDFIFCRNVYIYFHENQIIESAKKMLSMLSEGGYFFTGVSESLSNLDLQVESQGTSIYVKSGANKNSQNVPVTRLVPTPTYKILCVDDSPTILGLLKNILTKEHGFEVVATAADGREALALMEKTKFDLITLDIHMPEMDGLAFLEVTQNKPRPPVLIISSVDRDDPALGQKVLALGAADYVEKPSLQNMSQAAEEIRSKLKLVFSNAKNPLQNQKPDSGNTSKANVLSSQNKIMVIDDSSTVRKLLKDIIQKDGTLVVVSEVENPLNAIKEIEVHKPDLITLDVHMPQMNGVELLKKIKLITKAPIVMVSSISKEEGPYIMDALSLGAIDYIQKPDFDHLASFGVEIRKKLKTICNAKQRASGFMPSSSYPSVSSTQVDKDALVLIGASTGGIEAIPYVLKGFPYEMPPILIVQHIPEGFSEAFAKRLQTMTRLTVKQGKDGDKVLPNHIYLAPGGAQMALRKMGEELLIRIENGSSIFNNNPSVDFLFKSAVQIKNKKIAAVILTGMGDDGAQGMRELKSMGARTIAQDEATCVVYGMPREAERAGGVEFIKPINEIANTVLNVIKTEPNKKSA